MSEDPGKWLADPAEQIHEGDQQHAAAMEALRDNGRRNGFVLFTKDDEGILSVRAYLRDAGSPARLNVWATFMYEYVELLASRISAILMARLEHLLMSDPDDDEREDDNGNES